MSKQIPVFPLPIIPSLPFAPPMAVKGPHSAEDTVPPSSPYWQNRAMRTLTTYRVVCGNGHPPFVRYYGTQALAESHALSHNMFVHGDEVIGNGLADVDAVFTNLP